MPAFYVPHPQEIPAGFEKSFKSFGMGPRAAVELARKLSLTKPPGPIIIMGSAGALKSHLRPGDFFIVKSLYLDGSQQELSIPKRLHFLPQASLTSVTKPVTRSTDKLKLGKDSGCDLVDCEMEFIWNEISDDLKPKLLFIRGVLDLADENLDFLEDYQIRWQSLVQPKKLLQFIKFVGNFFRYQKSAREFFIRVSDNLMLREESEVTRY